MIHPSPVVFVTPTMSSPTPTLYRSLVRTTSPSTEPVTLAEAKHHARVDISDDDTYIQTLIEVAREYVEDRLDTTLLTTIWEARYDEFPLWEIVLPRPPMLSATVTITYKDTEGTNQTLTSSANKFQVDHRTIPGRVYPNYAATWPATRGDENSVTVSYTAGYGSNASDVPAAIKHAMLLLIGHWHETRQPVTAGSVAQNVQVPLTFETLIQSMSYGVYR